MRNERAVICGFSVLIFRGIGFWENRVCTVHCALGFGGSFVSGRMGLVK